MVNHSVSEICISVSKNTEIDLNKKSQKNRNFFGSVAEPEPPGATSFEAAPELEPIFW